ncbi:MAG: hypothetical protein ACJ8GW_08635 [Massilia sp.]
MKKLLAVTLLCALAGCATTETARPVAYAQPRDPGQWRVVSVTPVPAGTAARIASASPNGKAEEFSSTEVAATPPAYLAAPQYQSGATYVYPQTGYVYPAPVYVQEPAYYWPPVSLSLGFMFGRGWYGGGHYGHYGHRRY